jgi:ATP-dependent 26S proteasome regulatory subunit
MGLGFMVNAQSEMETEITVGIVQEVLSSSITVIDSDSELKVIVNINSQTIFENIKSSDEIQVEENIYIDYLINEQLNVAVNIYKMGVVEDEEVYEYKDYTEKIDTFEGFYDESEEEK